MFMFEDIIEDEMERLREMVENKKLLNNKANNFLRDYDWEDDFSHNDIWKMQEEFIIQAKKYLKKECKNKYIIYCDWCIHICSVEFFNRYLKENLYRYEIC